MHRHTIISLRIMQMVLNIQQRKSMYLMSLLKEKISLLMQYAVWTTQDDDTANLDAVQHLPEEGFKDTKDYKCSITN